jgi:hypothetical protein
MEVACSSKVLVCFYQASLHFIPEDSNPHSHCCENLKFHTSSHHTSTFTNIYNCILEFQLIAVATWSKAWAVLVRLNTRVMGLNPTRGMDACVHLFCVCVVLCVGSSLMMGWPLIQGVLPTVYRITKLKKRPRSKGLQSHSERIKILKLKQVGWWQVTLSGWWLLYQLVCHSLL